MRHNLIWLILAITVLLSAFSAAASASAVPEHGASAPVQTDVWKQNVPDAAASGKLLMPKTSWAIRQTILLPSILYWAFTLAAGVLVFFWVRRMKQKEKENSPRKVYWDKRRERK